MKKIAPQFVWPRSLGLGRLGLASSTLVRWTLVLSTLILTACVSPEGQPGTGTKDGGVLPIFDSGSGPNPCGGGDGGDGSRGDGGRDGGCGNDGSIPIEPDAGPIDLCNDITFQLTSQSASTVWVTGSFTNWAATLEAGAIPLVKEGNVFRAKTRIEPTGRHVYKFIVDGTTWVADPANPQREDDGQGGQNSVIEVCGATCGESTDFDWRDSVLYFVMTDRFFDGDGMVNPVPNATGGNASTGPSGQYAGGDLTGVSMKLPYLADLGVSAMWLSAPYENRNLAGASTDPASDPRMYSAYHGYWPAPANIDYSNTQSPNPRPIVESRIGTSDDLHTLVDSAHATPTSDGKTMKMLFDYVMKHVDDQSGLAQQQPGFFISPVRTCGDGNVWSDPYWGTRCAFTTYLPSFDFYQDAPRRWSVADALYWATEYELDGYRLDAVKHIPLSWLTDLRSAVSRAGLGPNNYFYMVGETFDYDDRGLLRSFVNKDTMLDGQFDFPLKARLCEAVFRPEGSMSNLATFMDGNDNFYGPGSLMSTWIGNHDIPRSIHFASREFESCREGSWVGNAWTSNYQQPQDAAPYERLALSYVVLLTNPGMPLIYYGDEIGLAGGGDPDNRRMMNWNESSLLPAQRALRTTISQVSKLRGIEKVLGRGQRLTLSADQDTWVYRRTGCANAGMRDVIVAINRADVAKSINLPAGNYVNLITEQSISGGSQSLPPRGFLIVAPAAN